MKYTFVLYNPGGNKLHLIKAIKMVSSLGLKEAKDVVDNASSGLIQKVKGDAPLDRLIEFKKYLTINCSDCVYHLDTVETDRQNKLIELGLLNKDELIDIFINTDLDIIKSLFIKNEDDDSILNIMKPHYTKSFADVSTEELQSMVIKRIKE